MTLTSKEPVVGLQASAFYHQDSCIFKLKISGSIRTGPFARYVSSSMIQTILFHRVYRIPKSGVAPSNISLSKNCANDNRLGFLIQGLQSALLRGYVKYGDVPCRDTLSLLTFKK